MSRERAPFPPLWLPSFLGQVPCISIRWWALAFPAELGAQLPGRSAPPGGEELVVRPDPEPATNRVKPIRLSSAMNSWSEFRIELPSGRCGSRAGPYLELAFFAVLDIDQTDREEETT